MSKTVTILKALGLPFAYQKFAEGENPLLPFAVYKYTGSQNFNADGVVYYPIAETEIDLYTEKKEKTIEKRLEKLLDNAEICYSKAENYIESEKMYEIIYSFSEIMNTAFLESNEDLYNRLNSLQEKISEIENQSVEVLYTLELTQENIEEKSLELPFDCDTTRAITFTIQGAAMQKGTAWNIEEYVNCDKIIWAGLELDGLARQGDKVSITYYKQNIQAKQSEKTEIELIQEQIQTLEKRIAELSKECMLVLKLSGTEAAQKYIELPYDCDTTQAIIFTLQGAVMQYKQDWDLIKCDWPEKDKITWAGLSLDGVIQSGDEITVTYYKVTV